MVRGEIRGAERGRREGSHKREETVCRTPFLELLDVKERTLEEVVVYCKWSAVAAVSPRTCIFQSLSGISTKG